MRKYAAILQHSNGHDHGDPVLILEPYFFCEGFNDGCKEYVKDGVTGKIYERYSCYSVISPYGWKETSRKWDDIVLYFERKDDV